MLMAIDKDNHAAPTAFIRPRIKLCRAG
jgi:hypothetical protein